MRPGASSKAVDPPRAATSPSKGYGEFFNHGLGHGFGLQIHEAPFFRPNTDVTLEAGMVVTCEPGIYLPAIRRANRGRHPDHAGWPGDVDALPA